MKEKGGLLSPTTERAMDISAETFLPSGSKESVKKINYANHDKGCDAKSPCLTDTELNAEEYGE